jgi:hypothetical protein
MCRFQEVDIIKIAQFVEANFTVLIKRTNKKRRSYLLTLP